MLGGRFQSGKLSAAAEGESFGDGRGHHRRSGWGFGSLIDGFWVSEIRQGDGDFGSLKSGREIGDLNGEKKKEEIDC
jgi:hypothetical protein